MKKRLMAFALSMAMLLGSTPLYAHAEDVTESEQVEDAAYYLQHDGYSYENDTLYYKGLPLNENGMYVTTDSDGNTCELDPADPDFDRYVLGEEEENTLRQDASGASNTTGLDGITYVSPDSVDGKTVHRGVDVSGWQGAINWPALKAAGVEFAIVRVCARDLDDSVLYADSKYGDNINGAYAAGIRVGAYVFSQAVSTEEAVQEAQYAMNLLSGYKDKISLPVFMDYEVGNRGHLLNKWNEEHAVSGFDYKSRHTEVINAFCKTMSDAGYTTGVYANLKTMLNEMNLSSIPAQYYIWQARYNTTNVSYTGRLNCWQYTSKYDGYKDFLQGNRSGGKIDCDFWYGDFPGLSTAEGPARNFVTRLYQVVLQREPDAEGLNNWVTYLTSGNGTGADVAHDFYLSKEMMNRNLSKEQYVDLIYQGMLGRGADPAGKANWVAALDAGASYEYVFAGFVGSQEFTKLCSDSAIVRGNYTVTQGRDRNLNVTKFVSRLYTKALGRDYDVDGLNNWCNSICSNPSRANVLNVATQGFLNSKEFKQKQLSNEEYVKVLYRVFLDREYDEPGLQDWVNRLNHGTTRDEVAAGFAYSKEFTDLMASYGL